MGKLKTPRRLIPSVRVGANLTNENKSLFTSRRQFILTETPVRPRVVELTFSYHYSSR